MTDPNSQVRHEATPSTFDKLLDLLKARFLSIVFVVLVVLVGAAIINVDLSVPRWAHLFALVFIVLLPYGYIIGNYVASLLWNEEHIFVVDLDARFLDGALYAFPPAEFRDLETREGQMCRLTPHLFTAKNVDLQAGECLGTWRGTLDDRDLLRALHNVDECRGELQEDAKRGFAIETQAWTIIRSATRAATKRVVRTFEDGTLPDEGNSIDRAIDEALERYDLDDRLRRIDMDDDSPKPEELEGIEPDEFDPDDGLDELLEDDPNLVDPGPDGRLSVDD